MSELDAEHIAKRLGLTDAVICQLQAHGYLQRLAITTDELDARIYRAHLAYHRREEDASPLAARPETHADRRDNRRCFSAGRSVVRARRRRAAASVRAGALGPGCARNRDR